MVDICCHIKTPINIEDKKNVFVPPILFRCNIYVINEKILYDALSYIGCLSEYIYFIRENGYENTVKWLGKKNLMIEEFLEGVSQYWIEGIHLKHLTNYKYFHKNADNLPVISQDYLKKLFLTVFLYNIIKEHRDRFNEYIENEINLIEQELSSVNDDKKLKIRQNHYKNNIFELLADNFCISKINILNNKKFQEIRNINFACKTILNTNDLAVYKISDIADYKNYNFKQTKTSYNECIKGNTLIHLTAKSNSKYFNDEYYMKSIVEEIIQYSKDFTCRKVDLGVVHLKKIMGQNNSSYIKRKNEQDKYFVREIESSNVALLEEKRTSVLQAENHIISQYSSIKDHSDIYFASENEMSNLPAILNLSKYNLSRINNLIWETPYEIETGLVKFIFNNLNVPYSSYGFASLRS